MSEHPDIWVRQWQDAGVPPDITLVFYNRYGAPPDYVTQAVINDDFQAGIGPIKLGTSDAVKRHDIEHLLHKLGYPVSNIPEVQLGFLGRSAKQAVTHLYLAPRDLVFGVVGATVGAAIMVWREVF